MEERGLPGLKARYEFVPAGEAVELRLRLEFDPAEAGKAEAARDSWSAFRERLAGGAEGKPPPAAVGLVTTLAATALTATADGAGLSVRLADFVAEVLAGFDRAAAAELAFRLVKAGAAQPPGDIVPLDVRLDLGGQAAVASPRLDGDLRDFATVFEQAWQGLDGTGARLALAAGSSEEPALWCLRTGGGQGLAIARPAAGGIGHHAVPPFSTAPLKGSIEEADGGSVRVEAIDLDHWWDLFAFEFARLARAAGPGDLRDRFDRVRGALARAMAGRLVPVAGDPAGEGIEEIRAVFEEAAAVDLRSRPVVCAAAVEVSRTAAPRGEPVPVLHGRAAQPSGAAGGAGVSPGAVRLEAGRRSLAYAAPPSHDDRSWQAFSIRFDGDRVEREGAPPLSLILRADALGVDLGRQSAPVPLIALPDSPLFSAAAAMASPGAQALSAALAWTVEIALPTIPAAQDRLELAVAFEGAAAPVLPPASAAEGSLFGALGRAVRFAGALPAEPDPDSLARFAAFAEAVADALPGWQAAARQAPALPGEWCYAIDFGDLPALSVTRQAQGSARTPPWPEVAGYATPACEGATARYEAETDAAPGLRISVPGLRLPADRIVRVHGGIVRNGSLAPAFVYHSPTESSEAVSPRLEWQAPQPEPPAASLEAALGALLAAVDEESKGPYALGLETVLVRRLEPAGEAPLEIRFPLALVPGVMVGGEGGVGIAALAREVAGAHSVALGEIDPGPGDEEIALAVTLFDEPPARGPLARLGFRIPVSGAWWEPA